MNRVERFEQEIYDSGVRVVDCRFDHPRLKGEHARVYLRDRNAVIYIDKSLTNAQRLAFLAHEMGHLHSMFGGAGASSGRSEAAAWRWAYQRLAPIDELTKTFLRHASEGQIDMAAVAEDLDLPEWFVVSAARHYCEGTINS